MVKDNLGMILVESIKCGCGEDEIREVDRKLGAKDGRYATLRKCLMSLDFKHVSQRRRHRGKPGSG